MWLTAAQAASGITAAARHAANRASFDGHEPEKTNARGATMRRAWLAGRVSANTATPAPTRANAPAVGRRTARATRYAQPANPAAKTESLESSWKRPP